MGLLVRQERQQVGKSGQNSEPNAPAVPIACPEQSRLSHDRRGRRAGSEQASRGLGDHEPEVVRHAVIQAAGPVASRVGVAEGGLNPDHAVADLDRAGRDVICPEIEGAAA
jgi:hypothetical protein